MKKPVLVIMAAGMGSRYGGLKQMDPVDEKGRFIIDYSAFDAARAGFETVVCVIKRSMEKDFAETAGRRIERHAELVFAYQDMDDIPSGRSIPEGRIKPWGTAHAVLSARKAVNGRPFAAINADDYYGPQAFSEIYKFMSETEGQKASDRLAMVGYELRNTVTPHGSVARGVCEADGGGYLSSITERTRIEVREGGAIAYTEDGGETWVQLSPDTVVSMNMWGLPGEFMEHAWANFDGFFDGALQKNPLKAEYFLPFAVERMIHTENARVKVLHSADKWYGMTYRDDKPELRAALARLAAEGMYPENF